MFLFTCIHRIFPLIFTHISTLFSHIYTYINIGPSIFETTVSVGYGVLAFAIPNRAYILFGIAAAGIHYYGEYASI